MRRALALFLLTLGLVSCTSGPQLEKYPRTHIKRPYTLPKGVATWSTLIVTAHESTKTDTHFLPPIPIPLVWKTSLSDNWTLHWIPLPLAVSQQIYYSETDVWGATYSLGGGYASGVGVTLIPAVNLYYRTLWTEKVALETTLNVTAAYHTKGDPWTWTMGFRTGPTFQLTDRLAIGPRVSVSLDRAFRTYESSDSVQPARETGVVIPFGLDAVWSFHRQWDLDFTYTYTDKRDSNGYVSHVGVVTLEHYW